MFSTVHKNFSYLITVKLVIIAALFHSAPIAYASVLAMAVTLAREGYERYLESKVFKNTLPSEAKTELEALKARVNAIEFGIKSRGF